MSSEEKIRRDERILEVYRECGSIRETRRRLGHSKKTIRRVIHGQNEPKQRLIARPARRPSKLDPYKAVVKRLVLEDQLTAVLVLEEIRALGYDGGYSTVKRYVRRIRPRPKKGPTTVVDHPPGDEGQVDWSPYTVTLGGEKADVHAFSMVLPFSSWMFLRFALDERLPTLVGLHDQAFEQLNAVPHRMSYDNMTTVGRHVSKDQVWLNPRFEAYAKAQDFEIHLIDQASPNQHAHVERHFDYVENNCLRRRRFRFDDLEDLNRHAAWWCDNVANVRRHGTWRERPVDRLERERPFLKPLPAARVEPYRLLQRTVRTDWCVALETNGYSVPPRFAGWPATLRLYTDRFEVIIDGGVVARHELRAGRHQRFVLPEHEDQFRRHTSSARLLRQAITRLGPIAEDYYQGLKTQRGRGAGHHIKRILTLADRHGSEAVIGAMAHAARFGNYSAEAVARVIAGKTLRAATAPDQDVPMPPERVRRWLDGLDVEGSDLADYDELIDRVGDDVTGPDPDEEDDDEA
jgi:transposase